jgi:hypothetical protein
MNAPHPVLTAPSRRQLLIGTLVAFVVAAIVLVAIVLPAEYGVDPIRTGKLLGLTEMSESGKISAQVMNAHAKKFLTGRIVINVKPGEGLEYKALLPAGEPLLYSWTAVGAPVHFEFHGEPTEGEWPKDYYRSYEMKDDALGAHGSFVAPFTGNHGWYWKNSSAEPVTITLEAAGFYSRLGRIGG